MAVNISDQSELDSTPGNQSSAPEFGPDQLKQAEESSIGRQSNPYQTSTSGGNVTYNQGESNSDAADLSSSTTPGKVEYSGSPDAPQAEQSLYNSTATKSGKVIFRTVFGTRRRKVMFGGGAVGTIIGLIFFFSFISGPLEIIHMGQLLTQFHFASQDDATNNRLLKMGRFINYAGKGELQYTRVGVFQAKWGKNLEADLNESGIQTAYSKRFNFFDGFVVDPNELANTSLSDLQGKSTEEIKAAIQEKFPDATIETHPTDPGKIFINAKGLGYRDSLSLTTFMLEASGKSRLASAIEARVMGGIYGLSWHPFSKLKTSLLRNLDNETSFRETEANEVEEGVPDATIQTGVDQTSTQNNPEAQSSATSAQGAAESIAEEADAAGTAAKEGDPSKLPGLGDSVHLKLAGGAAGAAGVLCLLKGIGDQAASLKQAQVILPLARMAGLIIAGGSQAQSGQDTDLQQVSYLGQQFDGVDSAGNKTSWDQAESIQAELGHPDTGVPPDSTLDSVGKSGNPFGFLSSGTIGSVLGPACSTVGQGILGVLTFFGASVADLTTQVVFAAVGPSLESNIVHWIAGDPVDALGVVGADFGNYINYGARIAANGAALTDGATALSTTQANNLQGVENVAWQQQYNNQSVVSKLFNPYDDRSAISKVIDNSGSSPTQDFASLGTYLLNFRHTLASLPSLFTLKAHAASTNTSWNYGFPEYGFSEQDLDNPAVENPYENAEDVVNILQKPDGQISPTGQTYIDRAKACFGATIAKDDNGIWGVVNTTIPAYSTIPSDCTDSSEDWLRVRFFIFDSKTADAMGCYYGDETACANVDFDASDATTSTASTSSTSTSSTAGSTIDMADLYNDSTGVACAPGTRDLGTQDGYTGGNKVEIRICAIPNLPSTGEESNGGFGVSGANGQAVVNSRVSGAVLAMVQAAAADGVDLTSISTFRTMAHQQALCAANSSCTGGDYTEVARPGTSNHQMGLAIDFGGGLPSTPGPIPGNAFWDWLTQNAANFGYKNYPAEAWHWSPTGN